MARPLRIEFPGALYHITARGDRRGAIYLDDGDRKAFLTALARVRERFHWTCHAYCLMDNHYHLLLETPEANLGAAMRQLNSLHSQHFNRRHQRVGHVYQGRYRAILVQKESHLLELARYIVLNPVRAGLVRSAMDWRWSSYRATVGMADAPAWLHIDWLLSVFGPERVLAREAYREFVSEGKRQPSPWQQLRRQIYLGDEQFVEAVQAKVESVAAFTEVPAVQRRPEPKSLEYYEREAADRNRAIATAYRGGGYSLKVIADYFGLHYSTVSRIVKAADDSARLQAPPQAGITGCAKFGI